MRIEVVREKGDGGYKALAGRYYQERNDLAHKLATLSVAHATTLETSMRQAQEIARLSHQLQITDESDRQAEVEVEDQPTP